MLFNIIIPSPGESITQVQLAKWLVTDGEQVEKDQEVVEIDSDKATFPLAAPEDGIIRLKVAEGETIAVGTVIAQVEAAKGGSKPEKAAKTSGPSPQPAPAEKTAAPSKEKKSAPAVSVPATPLAKKIIEEKQVPVDEIKTAPGSRKITRKDVENFLREKESVSAELTGKGSREEVRKKLTMLRLKLAERLVSVKNETAMLTTFNEVNMGPVLVIKNKYSEAFKEKFGVGIGFMSFFSKAATMALQEFPQVNSMIDGDEMITPQYVDLGIAVSAPKGLVVPVIRNAEALGLMEIEVKIKELATKARDNRIAIDDMKGGTFTITNGGVFGSLLSTPILNPPQSAILGMHKIMDRPIAVNGKVEIHPMMYLALSYDHRVVDGKDSVSFLVKIKELIENPIEMLTLGEDPIRLLLDL